MKTSARLLLSLTFAVSVASAACDSGTATPSPAAGPATATSAAAPTTKVPAAPEAPARHIEIRVDAEGYHPSSVEVHPNEAVILVVTRTTDAGCGQQLAIPDLDIRRDLPLDTPVEIMIRPTHGPLRFTCGMNMLEGTIVVQ